MKSSVAHNEGVSPLLFRTAAPRTSCAELPGHYDPAAQLWVVETKGGMVPLAQCTDTLLLDTSTSTQVRQEGDDEDRAADDRACSVLLDTNTLTKVRQEGEDEDEDMSGDETLTGRRRSLLTELATKTEVQQESDDELTGSGVLELETKTFAEIEGDDDSPIVH